MKCQHARPDIGGALLDVDVERLELAAEYMRERRALERHARDEGRLRQFAVAHMGEDAPLLQRMLCDDDRAGGGVELARRLEEDVPHEASKVWLAREALEVAADDCIGLGQLSHTFFSGSLPLAANVVHQPFAVQGCTDDAGGGLQGRQLG